MPRYNPKKMGNCANDVKHPASGFCSASSYNLPTARFLASSLSLNFSEICVTYGRNAFIYSELLDCWIDNGNRSVRATVFGERKEGDVCEREGIPTSLSSPPPVATQRSEGLGSFHLLAVNKKMDTPHV